MRRLLTAGVVLGVLVLAGVAFAQMGGPMAGGMGRAMMDPAMMGQGMMTGPGMMGPGTMGGAAGQAGCPGMTATGATGAQVTEEKAKELAQQYADQYLKGFTVEKVLPFAGMHMTMYQVELKGPEGETRILHVNPWGNVMPFGGPWRRG